MKHRLKRLLARALLSTVCSESALTHLVVAAHGEVDPLRRRAVAGFGLVLAHSRISLLAYISPVVEVVEVAEDAGMKAVRDAFMSDDDDLSGEA